MKKSTTSFMAVLIVSEDGQLTDVMNRVHDFNALSCTRSTTSTRCHVPFHGFTTLFFTIVFLLPYLTLFFKITLFKKNCNFFKRSFILCTCLPLIQSPVLTFEPCRLSLGYFNPVTKGSCAFGT